MKTNVNNEITRSFSYFQTLDDLQYVQLISVERISQGLHEWSIAHIRIGAIDLRFPIEDANIYELKKLLLCEEVEDPLEVEEEVKG